MAHVDVTDCAALKARADRSGGFPADSPANAALKACQAGLAADEIQRVADTIATANEFLRQAQGTGDVSGVQAREIAETNANAVVADAIGNVAGTQVQNVTTAAQKPLITMSSPPSSSLPNARPIDASITPPNLSTLLVLGAGLFILGGKF